MSAAARCVALGWLLTLAGDERALPPEQRLLPAPELLAPGPVALLPEGTSSVELVWRPVPGAASYAVRVHDLTDPAARERPSDCPGDPHYLCLEAWTSTSIRVRTRPGRAYRWWVQARAASGQPGHADERMIYVQGGLQALLAELARQAAQLRAHLEQLEPMAERYRRADGQAVLAELGWLRLYQRQQVSRCVHWMYLLDNVLREHMRDVAIQSGVALARAIERRRSPEQSQITRYSRLVDASDGYRRVLERGNRLMEEDEAAFQAAAAQVRRQRRRRVVLAASLAMVLTGALAWLLLPAGAPAQEAPAPALPAPELPASFTQRAGSGAPIGGSYRLLRRLGQGRLGPLYEAYDERRRVPVVIQRIREDFQRSERDLDRLVEEARRVAALRHPHLAEIYSVFLEGDRLFLAVENVAGQPLDAALDGAPAGMDFIRNVLSQAASVVDYAHEQRVLHGDLRPGNVLLRPDGLVKVKSFSLALLALQLEARLAWAQAARSLAYVAPEQEVGSPEPASDVFSLGVLLYEMATGRLPFEGADCLARKRARDFAPPSWALPGLPAGLDAVVARALDPEPARRFPTASELFEGVAGLPS